MRLPRDLSGEDLSARLAVLGYHITRQTGSHLRLTTDRGGEHDFFSKNDGLQNQNVLYVQKGLEGEPEVLIDPNTWSEDGTTRLAAFALSKDGRYAVVGIDRAGSDWQEYGVMEVAARTMRPDKLDGIKVSNPA